MIPTLSLPNLALLLAACGAEAADSLRSLAAILMERGSRAPRRSDVPRGK